MDLSFEYILQYDNEGEDIINGIITVAESSAHQIYPESKRASMNVSIVLQIRLKTSRLHP